MKKLDGHLWNIIPKYAVLPLICSFTFNSLIYTGTQILCRDLKHYDFTTAFDRAVPLIGIYEYLSDLLSVLGCELYHDRQDWEGALIPVLSRRFTLQSHLRYLLCNGSDDSGKARNNRNRDMGSDAESGLYG